MQRKHTDHKSAGDHHCHNFKSDCSVFDEQNSDKHTNKNCCFGDDVNADLGPVVHNTFTEKGFVGGSQPLMKVIQKPRDRRVGAN